MGKRMLHLCVIGFMLFVAGCSQTTSAQQFIKSVNEMFEAEEQYRESQKELQALEAEEQELLQQTLSLQPVDQLAIKENVDQLKQSVEARQVLSSEERRAMQNARKSVKRFTQLSVEREKSQKQLELFIAAVEERYLVHEDLMNAYEKYMEEQLILYDSFAEEQLEWRVLEVQVEKVNEERVYVVELTEKFNEITMQISSLQQDVLASLSD